MNEAVESVVVLQPESNKGPMVLAAHEIQFVIPFAITLKKF